MSGVPERCGWSVSGSGPDAYERYIVPAWMGDWAQELVSCAAISPGQRVLDLACGTGIVARKAAGALRGEGSIAGADFDPGMLQAAERFARSEGQSQITWHCVDAARLPFGTSEFDRILCQQGLQFFRDREAALREMYRVLAPGGSIALSLWCALERLPFLKVMAEVLSQHLGASVRTLFETTCSLSDREALRALVCQAGFDRVHIRLQAKVARYPSVKEFISGYISVFPQSAQLAAMAPLEQARLFARLARALEKFQDDDGLAAPMESHLLTATKSDGL